MNSAMSELEKLIEDVAYPTNCLSFLTKIPFSDATAPGPKNDGLKLNILVVGAGLGGLATAVALGRRGHSVTVLERAAELGEVGAGIQVPPNSARLLLSWGIQPFLQDKVIAPESITFRRWQSGESIGFTKLKPEFEDNFDAPYYVIHRAHLHDALHKLAEQSGAKILINKSVVKYDPNTPSVETDNGELFTADLVIAADGVRSTARKVVLGGEDMPAQKTRFAAYRATVPVEKMQSDPDLASILARPGINIWIGEDRHCMTYCIAGGKTFNMVLSHPDSPDAAIWESDRVLKDMRAQFEGWDPRLTKVIGLIDKTLKWPLMSGTKLPTWIAPSNKLLILGDAAHAMLPYMSQGAAMAVEDAAAIAEALSLINNRKQVPNALKCFEKERMKRAGDMQTASLLNGVIWHFPDGPKQRARDESMRAEVEGRIFSESANQWSDPATQAWCYGYDAEDAIRKAWKASQQTNGSVNGGSVYK
ncbi:FAD-dependent monooxygenase OpS4 [Lasiodiplodia theobromae]|uniref:FAD-dependent monooxygenase OpS4 n=1 Tax=Lasiodiplodia theobromae TaxID=45133 RepID=A0A5N5DDA3_9PEZI|nr:FAD-dependent monooxygenase OpS4 [Lasiodiplodia theobromae]